MFFAVLIFFREPRRSGEMQTASLREALKNFWTVISNPRFMLFLLIFSGYWVVYWQEFIILPLYVHDYINPKTDTELMLITGPLVVIAFTMVINILMQKVPSFRAIILGTLISALAWIVLIIFPSVPGAYLTLVVVALGEITQSPRYYYTFPDWRLPDNKELTWALPFSRLESDRLLPAYLEES